MVFNHCIMINIVLVEPEKPGNIGAVARVMANFEFENLFLVNPKCNHLDKESLDRASHAKNILEKAKIISFKELKKFDYKIATTAQLGTDYNVLRSPVNPEELIKIIKPKANIAIIFGRECNGLTNQEINQMDFIVTIPTSKKYQTMNLSHSVAIILYELFKQNENITSHIRPISQKELEQIEKMFNKLLEKVSFTTKEKKETQRKVWKRIISKSFMSKREAYAVMGLLKKLIEK